jgi:3-dehydroquinate synthase
MRHINIYSGERCISRVVISSNFEGLEAELARHNRVFAVMDNRVAAECPASHFLAEFFGRKGVPGMLIEASEQTKTIDTVMEVCSWLLDQGADRDALVLAIGGGVTSDIVGFAAAIYKRGIRSAYIPTTFLAQVDAAIGGKTGVNYNNYKNVLGVIRQPEFTYLCPQVLESLSRRDFLSGAAELLKTFIIEDNGYFDRAVQWLRGYALTQTQEAGAEYMNATMEELLDLIAAAAQVKISIVSRDQFERGERRKLNLGHTFGHAIETLAQRKGYDITHGEAVAMGMLMAARLAERIGGLEAEKGLADRLEADMRVCGLTVDCPYEVSKMAEVMAQDKKAQGNVVHFVLPLAVGKVTIHDMTVSQACRLLEA